MDSHPPSWSGNGAEHLGSFGLVSSTMSRLSLARPQSDVPTDVDAVALARGLAQNFSLKEVELYRCRVGTEDAEAIAQALSVNKYLEHVGLSRNSFGTHAGESIAEALQANQTLRSLDLSWTGVGDEAAAGLAEALLVNNALQRLDLDRNSITCDGAGALATALSRNTKLRYLSLSSNRIKAGGASFLGAAAARSASLTTLDLSGNGIPEAGMFSVLHSIAHAQPGCGLSTLNLAFNNIGNAVAVAALVVANLRSLRELNLESTNIAASASLDAFGKALACCSTLCHLSLAQNHALGNDGLRQLRGGATDDVKSNLRYLDLTDTGIDAGGLGALSQVVAGCPELATLHVSRNKLGPSSGLQLAEIVSAAKKLTFLGASDCGWGSAGMERFAGGLKYSATVLTGLSVAGNSAGDSGVAHLLPVVLHHGAMRFLDVSRNDCTSGTLDRFPDVFESNPSLPWVALAGDKIVTRGNQYDGLENIVLPCVADTPWPPACRAASEFAGAGPSSGFASYSISVGSAVMRQSEGASSPIPALLAHAGKAVRHAGVWDGPKFRKVTPNLRSARFNQQVPDAAAVEIENNLGGLMVTDDQLRREFNRLDANGNGFLDAAEMKHVYSSLEHYGVKLTPRDLERLVAEAGDGSRIDFDQFCVLYLKLVRA